MAITTTPPSLSSLDPAERARLEIQLHELTSRKDALSPAEYKEYVRLEGLLHLRNFWETCGESGLVSPTTAKNFQKKAAELDATELTAAKLAKVQEAHDLHIDPELEHQLFPDENADPTEQDLPLAHPSSSTAPALNCPTDAPKTVIQKAPVSPLQSAPVSPAVPKPLPSAETASDKTQLIVASAFSPEMETEDPDPTDPFPSTDTPDVTESVKSPPSPELDPDFLGKINDRLNSVTTQFAFTELVIPGAAENPHTIFGAFDRYFVRKYTLAEFPTEMILQVLMVKFVPLAGQTAIDAKGIHYTPISSTEKIEIESLKSSYLTHPITVFHEFSTLRAAVDESHQAGDVQKLAQHIRPVVPRVSVRHSYTGDFLWVGHTRLHLDICAMLVFAHPPANPSPSVPFFGFPMANVFFLGLDHLEDFIRYRCQKNDAVLAHNQKIVTAPADQSALLRFYAYRSVCAFVGSGCLLGMGISSLLHRFNPVGILLGIGAGMIFGAYWWYSVKFLRQLQQYYSPKLIWDMKLSASQVASLCKSSENPAFQAQLRFEQGRKVSASPEKTAIFRRDSTKSSPHEPIHQSVKDRLKAAVTHSPHTQITPKLSSPDTKPKAAPIASSSFHKEDSISSFLED